MSGGELLRRELLVAQRLDPRRGFERTEARVEVRWDPLTGQTARLVESGRLMPPGCGAGGELARRTRADCPFCAERLEAATPRLAPEISAEGRLRQGEAVLFPNLLAYARHSSVSVYSPRRHLLPLADVSSRLVADNLATQVAFARAVIAADPSARWASVNANHLPPSGSSIFHPHLQGSVDPHPTTAQRQLAGVPPDRFDAYLAAERRAGERYLGSSGRVEWLAGFAPLAPGELRAFTTAAASPAELDAELVEELGFGIATAFRLYAELGYDSANLAVYGAPPGTAGYPLNLRLAVRSALRPFYRSDASYLERLHLEAAVDLTPEQLAARAGRRFAR